MKPGSVRKLSSLCTHPPASRIVIQFLFTENWVFAINARLGCVYARTIPLLDCVAECGCNSVVNVLDTLHALDPNFVLSLPEPQFTVNAIQKATFIPNFWFHQSFPLFFDIISQSHPRSHCVGFAATAIRYSLDSLPNRMDDLHVPLIDLKLVGSYILQKSYDFVFFPRSQPVATLQLVDEKPGAPFLVRIKSSNLLI